MSNGETPKTFLPTAKAKPAAQQIKNVCTLAPRFTREPVCAQPARLSSLGGALGLGGLTLGLGGVASMRRRTSSMSEGDVLEPLMPQPFDPNKQHQLTPDAMRLRPEMAVQVASIASLWSFTEMLQGQILAHLVRGDPAAAAALYTAMKSLPGQRQGILEVARAVSVDKGVRAELDQIFKVAKNRASERNEVVHGLWGISDLHPKDLIHCTVESALTLHARTHDARHYSGATLEELDANIDNVSIRHLKLSRYTESDFTEISKRIDGLNHRMMDLLKSLKPERYLWQELFGQGTARPARSKNSPPPQAK